MKVHWSGLTVSMKKKVENQNTPIQITSVQNVAVDNRGLNRLTDPLTELQN